METCTVHKNYGSSKNSARILCDVVYCDLIRSSKPVFTSLNNKNMSLKLTQPNEVNKCYDDDCIDKIMEQTKCYICYDVSSHIFQCVNGHIACRKCLKQLHQHNGIVKCGICRNASGWSRNLVLENVFNILDIRVPCGIDGCCKQFNMKDVCDHRKQCRYNKFECPIDESCGSFCKFELQEHMETHQGNLIDINEISIINLRFFSNTRVHRQVLTFKTNILIFDFLFSEVVAPWYYVYGTCIGEPLTVKISNVNPNNEGVREECVCLLDDEMKIVFKPKSYDNCIVSEEHRGIKAHVGSEVRAMVKDLIFCSNDFAEFTYNTRDNFANFVSISLVSV